MKKVGFIVVVALLSIPIINVQTIIYPPSQIVQAAKKKTTNSKLTAKKATTNKKLAKYLKKTKNSGYLVRSVKTVDEVPTIVINDVTSLNKPVFYEYMAQLIGNAKATPKASKGIGIVQQNEYRDASGKKKKLMEFGFFFDSNTLKRLSFSTWKHMVYKDPKAFYNEANGYYLMSEFAKDAKKRKPNGNLMKADDANIIASYMDRFGTN